MHEERLVELGATFLSDRHPNGPSVIRAVLAADEARLFVTIDEPRCASRRGNDGVSDLVLFQPTGVALAKLQQDVEPGEGQLTAGFEFGPNFPRHSSIRLE